MNALVRLDPQLAPWDFQDDGFGVCRSIRPSIPGEFADAGGGFPTQEDGGRWG